LFAETSTEAPKCIKGMLAHEVKTFEALMLAADQVRCAGSAQKIINKCKRTCFTDVKPIDADYVL